MLHDRRRVEVQHARLGRHHDEAVVGHPDAGRPQPVAVEHGADDRAVGEAHRRRSVPRLHQRRVVLVERPPGGVHRLVPLPRLRDHHQHGVGQAAAAEVQQFEHLVEARGVRGAGGADREDLVDVVVGPEDVGVDQRLARPHPVLVAGDGVDLAVVGDPTERVGQRPRREGVGGEPRVHDAERAGQPLVLQVEVERLQLRRGQHALVDEGLTGKAWEVDGFTSWTVLARALGAEFVFGALAHHVRAALQVHDGRAPVLPVASLAPADEHLPEGRHRVARQRAERGIVGRHLAPAEHRQPLGLGDLADGLACCRGVLRRLRKEGDARGVAALVGQVEVDDRPEELIGHLQQDARAVAGVRLCALGATVLQVQQGRDGLVDDVAAAPALHVGDHRDTAGVVLVRGVVQPYLAGRHSHLTISSRRHA